MPASVAFDFSTLLAFALVLARVGGAFVFVPMPGMKDAPQPARIVLALALTVALYPSWPAVDLSLVGPGRMVAWMAAEASLGVTVGLAVAFITEAFLVAAQVIGMQAGYAYASMVDPNTQADSSVLLVFAQLMAGLLFFAIGLDREILRILAHSLRAYPPGNFQLSGATAEAVLRLSGGIFTIGVRLALPVVALLVLVDLSLALMGRLNAQLQLLSMAFPAKMIAALGLLAWMAAVFPRVYRSYAVEVWGTLARMLHG